MNEEKKHSRVETTTLTPVPMKERKSWINVALIQAGIMICVPSLLLGGMLVQSMSLGAAITAGIIGYIIVIVLFCLMGIIGSDLGVPTCMTSVGGFGKTGARIFVSLITFISMIGWFAVQTGVCGNAFTNLFDQSFGINIPPIVSMVIWGVIMMVTAVYGIDALGWLNKIAIPALFIVTVIGCWLSLNKFGTGALYTDTSDGSMSMADGILLTVSFMTAGCLAASDITRYQATRRDTVLSSSIGVFPAGVAMVVLGAVMTKVADQYDITQVFCEVGIPVLAMIVLITSAWTTNTANAYSGGINAVLMLNLKDDKRAAATVVSGILGTVCAAFGLADHFEAFLTILGEIMLPMMGVIIADYWITGRGKAANYKLRAGFNWVGIVSWLVGYGVTKLIPYGVPFVQGIVVTMILYVVGMKLFGASMDKGAERLPEAAR